MKTIASKFMVLFLALSILGGVGTSLPSTAQAANICLSTKDSRIAIATGMAKALGQLMKRRGEARLVGSIIEASLCLNSNQRLFYKVKLLMRNGKVAKIRFFANDGSNF